MEVCAICAISACVERSRSGNSESCRALRPQSLGGDAKSPALDLDDGIAGGAFTTQKDRHSNDSIVANDRNLRHAPSCDAIAQGNDRGRWKVRVGGARSGSMERGSPLHLDQLRAAPQVAAVSVREGRRAGDFSWQQAASGEGIANWRRRLQYGGVQTTDAVDPHIRVGNGMPSDAPFRRATRASSRQSTTTSGAPRATSVSARYDPFSPPPRKLST